MLARTLYKMADVQLTSSTVSHSNYSKINIDSEVSMDESDLGGPCNQVQVIFVSDP